MEPHLTPVAFRARFAGVPLAGRPRQLRTLATTGQYRRVYALTQRYLADARETLDWGCGDGHFSLFLRALGHQVTGYSYESPPTILRGDHGFRFVAGLADDPVALPFPDGRFDAAFSVGVLEHVHETGGDQRASVQELLRVLRPGGCLFVFHLPNRSSWIETTVRAANRMRRTRRFQHSLLFSEASARALFAGLPARLLDLGRYNVLPRNSLAWLPAWLHDSKAFCAAFDAVDGVCATLAPALCQNWYLVAERTR